MKILNIKTFHICNQPDNHNDDNYTFRLPRYIANGFNDYFTKIGPLLSTKIPPCKGNVYDYMQAKITDTVLQWFSSYLTDRTHYVSLSNHCSAFAPVHSAVPQGSVLGPILFTMYIKPLSAIIDSHSIIHHSFADDLQLQMSAPPDRISELLHSMQSCISDVKAWATANMLKLNDSKTELMFVTSKRSKHLHNLPTSITIGNAQIPFKQSVKNLGFTLDCHLTMNAHVSNIARTCYF